MRQESAEHNHIPPAYLRLVLIVVLLTSGTILFYAVNWMYHRIHDHLGLEIAEVVVAFLMILIVILILLGFGAGIGADQILHRRKLKALWIYRSLKCYRIMRSLWWYIKPSGPAKSAGLPVVETITLPERPPRRGRRPTHSLDRWARVVQAWENRDPQRNTMTLAEYLAEQFGTYADGSPQMSENIYYEWRKKVFREIRKQEARKKDRT